MEEHPLYGGMKEKCTWCGAEVEPDDGFRAYEPAGERRAVFCRLEHLIPWSIQGAHWEPGEMSEPAALDEGATRCSHCGASSPMPTSSWSGTAESTGSPTPSAGSTT